MKIFLDFDDTLFDTRAFAIGAQQLFSRYGISEERFWTSYHEIRKGFSTKGWAYSFERHLEKLRTELSGDAAVLAAALDAYLNDTSRFLFPDVLETLGFFKSKRCSMYILSFGDADFQRKKVLGSGIGPYLDGILVTADDQGALLAEQGISDGEDMWFFDDKVAHVDDMKKAFPSVRTVLVRRVHKEHHDTVSGSCDHVVTDLTEARRLFE